MSMRRLKAAQAALTPKLQALREIEGWQRWANVGIQEQLCEKMEALKSEENPEEIARRIRELQQQWRQAADVPRAQSDALWQRFKAAHDEVWARCEAHFAAEAVTRAENLQKKVALCEQVEALADSTRWIQTADEIKTLQAEWKTIGPVSRGQEKAVWERFRAACDRFFTRRHDDLAQRKTAWSENSPRRTRSARGSRRWPIRPTGSGSRRDQAAAGGMEDDRPGQEEPLGGDLAAFPRRRAIGFSRAMPSATRSRAANAWRRARRSAPSSSAARTVPTRRRCRRLTRRSPAGEAPRRNWSPGSDRCARAGSRRSPRAAWNPARAAELDRRFAAAFERLRAARPEAFAGTDLDPDANRQRMEALVGRVEKLAASFRGPASRRRRGAVAGDAARRHAQGSAAVQYHRRQGRRGQPRARRRRRCAAGAGQLVANRSRPRSRAPRVGGPLSASVPRASRRPGSRRAPARQPRRGRVGRARLGQNRLDGPGQAGRVRRRVLATRRNCPHPPYPLRLPQVL